MSKKWVLLVDDDPAMLLMLEGAVEHPELSVTTATDAVQAFIQARDLKPFVIVSDIQMPGGQGPTIIERLRADPRLPRVPIIFMTGMELAKARELLPKNDPTIGLLQKPFELRIVRDYIWKLAGILPPQTPSSGVISVTKKWVLLVDDDPAMLTLIEDAIAHPELRVTTADDAVQAFIQARELKPLLIISDIQMPGGNGDTIMTRLREDATFPSVPMIFMTGMDLAKARAILPKRDPLIGLMQKPLNLEVLRDYVWKLAGLTAPPKGAP